LTQLDRCSPEAIREQLERVIGSAEFAASERLSKFLRYVVGEALHDRGDRIKAYSVAVEVFGRDESFDAQLDPVVRIEAGRLRRALEMYYLRSGQTDPIVIGIPKGGYVPSFTKRSEVAHSDPSHDRPKPIEAPAHARSNRKLFIAIFIAIFAAAITILGALAWVADHRVSGDPARAGMPSLMVMPFVSIGDAPEIDFYAVGISEEVLSQLSRFRELRIIGRETARSVPPSVDAVKWGRQFGVDFVLEGGVRVSNSRIRVTTRLLDTASSSVLWSGIYENSLTSRDLLDIQEDMARNITNAVAQPYGTIFRTDIDRGRTAEAGDLDAYSCILRVYAYRTRPNPEEHASVRHCLEEAIARNPRYPTAWALLSIVHLDEDRFGFNPIPDAGRALDRALAAAREAVRLEPDNVRALQALMMALFLNQQPVAGASVAERALALNPNDTELLSEFGDRIAMAGEWERGRGLIEQALVLNPGNSGHYHVELAFIAYMQKDNRRALAEIDEAKMDRLPLYHLIAALIYARNGMNDEAHLAAAKFLGMRPRFFEDLETEFAKRNLRVEDRAYLIEGFLMAGFPVPEASILQWAPNARSRLLQ
jgi:adenylate cyclase